MHHSSQRMNIVFYFADSPCQGSQVWPEIRSRKSWLSDSDSTCCSSALFVDNEEKEAVELLGEVNKAIDVESDNH